MIKRLYKAIKEAVKGKPLKVRSPRWDNVREYHLEIYPTCAACGRNVNTQVHHIKPFHLYPELELDRNNLITLCENKETKCHLKIGHMGSWRRINPDVTQSASEFKENLSKTIEP
jgi:5-methylcytosine-specific restriction endonuclease McrA